MPGFPDLKGVLSMKCILSADRNWGIGYKNSLLVRIPSDMKRFRLLTTGNTIIMGRKTLESFPDAKPLPDRNNIVITRNTSYTARDAVIVHSPSEALSAARDLGKEIYVILLQSAKA